MVRSWVSLVPTWTVTPRCQAISTECDVTFVAITPRERPPQPLDTERPDLRGPVCRPSVARPRNPPVDRARPPERRSASRRSSTVATTRTARSYSAQVAVLRPVHARRDRTVCEGTNPKGGRPGCRTTCAMSGAGPGRPLREQPPRLARDLRRTPGWRDWSETGPRRRCASRAAELVASPSSDAQMATAAAGQGRSDRERRRRLHPLRPGDGPQPLWDMGSWLDDEQLPSAACILKVHVRIDADVEEETGRP